MPMGGHDALMVAATLITLICGAAAVVLAVRETRLRAVAAGPVASTGPMADAAAERSGSADLRRLVTWSIVLVSAGSGAIHLAAAPHHLAELGDLGYGFVISGVFQLVWAAAYVRRPASADVAWLGALVNVAVIAAWLWSRTVGLPVGDEIGVAEPIRADDGAATLFEIVLVAGLWGRGRGLDRWLRRRIADGRAFATIVLVPVVGIVVVTTALAANLAYAGHDLGPAVHTTSHGGAAPVHVSQVLTP